MTFPISVEKISDIPQIESRTLNHAVALSKAILGPVFEGAVLQFYDSWRSVLDEIADGDVRKEKMLGTMVINAVAYGQNIGSMEVR